MNAAKNTGQYSEDSLVEQPAIALFAELGWETTNLYQETFGETGTEGRESEHEVILVPRLRNALERLTRIFRSKRSRTPSQKSSATDHASRRSTPIASSTSFSATG